MRTRLCRGGLVIGAVASGVVALSSCAGKELEPFGPGDSVSSGADSTHSSTATGTGLTNQVNTSTHAQPTGSSPSSTTSNISAPNTSTASSGASTSGIGQTNTGSSSSSTVSPGSTSQSTTSQSSTDDTTQPNDSSLPQQTTSTQSSGGTTSTAGSDTSEPPTSGPVEVDCNAAMPAVEGDPQEGNGRGGTGNLAWEIWSNTGEGELVTYDVPAFSAIWNEAGGYLGRMGYEWGQNPGPYESLGTITAQFVANKSGSGGDVYSYIGMYGWSTDPCVEWYVIEDSFRPMPVNPGTTTLMSDEVVIDGSEYNIYTRPTPGTGGTRCSGATEWIQYYSIRKTARSCGQISLTQHFDAWKNLQMPLGALLEAKILAEVGGGVGRVDFPIANVVVTPP